MKVHEFANRPMIRRLSLVILAAMVAPSSFPAFAQDAVDEGEQQEESGGFGMDRLFVPRWRLADGPQVRSAFREVVKEAGQATVCIHCDGKHMALGGIVSSDGWIITKATPLCGKLLCLLPDGRSLEAATVAQNREYDLALLKVDAKNLPVLELNEVKAPPVGSWLASVGRSRDPVAVGIVSVAPRAIPVQAGYLGVELDEELALVRKVAEEGAAEKAGIEPGDRIVSVAGANVTTRDQLKKAIGAFNPGDEIALVIERDGERLDKKATLTGQFPGFPVGRSDFQNTLGGKLSERRFGFPTAFQHDTALRPSDCGGPVVDLDGRVVGFNIARAGRTESYALPVSAVKKVMSELMADRLLVGADAKGSTDDERHSTAKPVVEPAGAEAEEAALVPAAP